MTKKKKSDQVDLQGAAQDAQPIENQADEVQQPADQADTYPVIDPQPAPAAQANGGPTPAEWQKCQDELKQAQAKTAEYLDSLQRSMADFANYRRRIERDQAQLYQTTAGNLIKRYLEVLDDLDRALRNRPTTGDGAAWATGIELVYRKFLNILESEGVKVMDAEGQQFDPTRHEAISQEESSDHESGQVIEVVSKGYVIGDRVLRPALVRVAM